MKKRLSHSDNTGDPFSRVSTSIKPFVSRNLAPKLCRQDLSVWSIVYQRTSTDFSHHQMLSLEVSTQKWPPVSGVGIQINSLLPCEKILSKGSRNSKSSEAELTITKPSESEQIRSTSSPALIDMVDGSRQGRVCIGQEPEGIILQSICEGASFRRQSSSQKHLCFFLLWNC